MVSQASWALLGFEEDRMCQPILTTTLLLAEDTYSSEELVDQQPVLLKVMDTADQVRHWGVMTSWTMAGPRLDRGSAAPLTPRMAPGTASATCAGPAPSLLSTASTTGRALRAASATSRSSPCTRRAASTAAPCSCWEISWTWSSTGIGHAVRLPVPCGRELTDPPSLQLGCKTQIQFLYEYFHPH